jgi:catechol 2,3-dioxygenase-like lactoylglutathione lyase family enzyme
LRRYAHDDLERGRLVRRQRQVQRLARPDDVRERELGRRRGPGGRDRYRRRQRGEKRENAHIFSLAFRGDARRLSRIQEPVYDHAVIKAVHTLIYSDDPEATRSFMRDVLGWAFVEHPESAPGWLIFKTGPSELGVHPTSGTYDGGEYSYPRHHSISLMCDDVEATRRELAAKGAAFSDEIQDLGFGLGITLELPGAGGILLY